MKPVNFGYRVAGTRDADAFGKRMHDAREHAGISEEEAAERGGLSLASLRRIERSQTKMVQTEIRLHTFAKLYGVPEVWLYAGDVAGKATAPSWYRIEAA